MVGSRLFARTLYHDCRDKGRGKGKDVKANSSHVTARLQMFLLWNYICFSSYSITTNSSCSKLFSKSESCRHLTKKKKEGNFL
jgi:hypothetical protein